MRFFNKLLGLALYPHNTNGRNMTSKVLLSILGWLCICLGVIGIFLPLLPTTPFLLLAAWCFSRSSERFHSWLINHRQLGPFINAWQNNQAIPRKTRNRLLCLLWISLLCSALIIGRWWVAAPLLGLGLIPSFILLRHRIE